MVFKFDNEPFFGSAKDASEYLHKELKLFELFLLLQNLVFEPTDVKHRSPRKEILFLEIDHLEYKNI